MYKFLPDISVVELSYKNIRLTEFELFQSNRSSKKKLEYLVKKMNTVDSQLNARN